MWGDSICQGWLVTFKYSRGEGWWKSSRGARPRGWMSGSRWHRRSSVTRNVAPSIESPLQYYYWSLLLIIIVLYRAACVSRAWHVVGELLWRFSLVHELDEIAKLKIQSRKACLCIVFAGSLHSTEFESQSCSFIIFIHRSHGRWYTANTDMYTR